MAGPGDVSRIASVMTAIRGRAKSRATDPTTRSKDRFRAFWPPLMSTGLTAREVWPSTDSMDSLEGRMSETFVDSLISVLVRRQAAKTFATSSSETAVEATKMHVAPW
jgi:hypothetical protein